MPGDNENKKQSGNRFTTTVGGVLRGVVNFGKRGLKNLRENFDDAGRQMMDQPTRAEEAEALRKENAAKAQQKGSEHVVFQGMVKMFGQAEEKVERKAAYTLAAKAAAEKAAEPKKAAKKAATEAATHIVARQEAKQRRVEELTQQNIDLGKRSLKARFKALLKKEQPQLRGLKQLEDQSEKLKNEKRRLKARAAAEIQFQEEERKKEVKDAAQRKIKSLSEKLTSQQKEKTHTQEALKAQTEALQITKGNIQYIQENFSNLEKERQTLEKQQEQLKSAIENSNEQVSKVQAELTKTQERTTQLSGSKVKSANLAEELGKKKPELKKDLDDQTRGVKEFQNELQAIEALKKTPLSPREKIDLRARENAAQQLINETKTNQQEADQRLRTNTTERTSSLISADAAEYKRGRSSSRETDLQEDLGAGQELNAKLKAELDRIEGLLKNNEERREASKVSLSALQQESKELEGEVNSLKNQLSQQNRDILSTQTQKFAAETDLKTLARMGISSDEVGKQMSEGMSRAKQTASENYERAKQGMSDLGNSMSTGAQNFWNKLSPKDRQAAQEASQEVSRAQNTLFGKYTPSLKNPFRRKKDNGPKR